MYEAFVKRQAVERIEATRDSMVAALWSNSNWDDGKETRTNAIRDIDASAQESIQQIYHPEEEVVIDKNNPFWAAMKVPELPTGISDDQIKELERRAMLDNDQNME